MTITTTTVTAEQVKTACLAKNIKRVDHHECSICGYMVKYLIRDGELFFDPGCNCRDGDGPRHKSWQDAADLINMQTKDEWREKLMTAFGLTPGA